MTYLVRELEVQNAETGEMERSPGRPCRCGVCKGKGEPLLPGDPDRHDAGAGTHTTLVITQREGDDHGEAD